MSAEAVAGRASSAGAGAPVALVDYLRLATGYLDDCGSTSARLDAELLLADVLQLDRMSLYVNFDRPLEPAEVDRFRQALRRRCQGTPVAYILGRREFLSATLTVNPAVLIPRPETELLVEAVLQRLGAEAADAEDEDAGNRSSAGPAAGDDFPLIADVGTGSGAIAIGLAMALPAARIVAVDVSTEALDVARANAAAHDVAGRMEFLVGDLLTPLMAPPRSEQYAGRLDVIVSNPPYIATDDWQRLPPEVRDYEPRVALDGGPDGMALYRHLVPAAAEALKSGGLLALEIGADQAGAVRELLESVPGWRQIDLLQDYAGHDRIVLATKGT